MTPVQAEIAEIEDYLMDKFDKEMLIDSTKVKRLCVLKAERVKELVALHKTLTDDKKNRKELVQTKTRQLINTLSKINFHSRPDVQEHIASMMEEYDMASESWASSDGIPWEESEAYRLFVDILFSTAE